MSKSFLLSLALSSFPSCWRRARITSFVLRHIRVSAEHPFAPSPLLTLHPPILSLRICAFQVTDSKFPLLLPIVLSLKLSCRQYCHSISQNYLHVSSTAVLQYLSCWLWRLSLRILHNPLPESKGTFYGRVSASRRFPIDETSDSSLRTSMIRSEEQQSLHFVSAGVD